jgi:hypothetical protein
MNPRRYVPTWSALVLVFAAQCDGGEVSDDPGVNNPNPGAMPPPGMQPTTNPPGVTNPTPAPTTTPPRPPGTDPTPPRPGANPPPGGDPPTPPSPPGGPGVNPGSPVAGPAGPLARALQIGLVEVSQATFIKVGEGETEVEPAMRNAPVIEGRPLVVRIHVTPGPGFIARQLRGVATITTDGASQSFEDAKMIAGPSNPVQAQSTFNVLIPAVAMKPGARLAVAVYESGEAAGADPSPAPRFPGEGSVDLAVKAGRMVLDVVAVPVTGPGGPLADTPQRRQKLENDLYDVYPVQKVNIKVREPVTVTATITERAAAFGLLRDARTADGASARPWEYYHLLVDRTDTTFTFAGTAGGGGGSNNDPGSRRVALTLVRGRALDGNTNTVAHELGHNHGQPHVSACGANGGNLMYPLPDGAMASSGWSLSEGTLKSKAMYKELMGYCRPRWISDFMWSRLEARVRQVSAGARPPDGFTALEERSLLGYIGPGERPNWGLVAERVVEASAPMSASRYARLVLDDGRVVNAPVSVHAMSDELTREVGVTFPLEATVLRADVIIDGESYPVAVPSLYGPQ